VIVLVIIMIIFGAGKLPEIAKSLGQGVKEFRDEANSPVAPKSTASSTATVRSEVNGAVADVAERIENGAETVRADPAPRQATARDAI
jgi:sec-independent protein translocase protein TatA